MTASNLTQILLIQPGDVELNPGPKKSSSLTFFPWNLNGIAAHDFAKISLIQCYALSCNTDIIFLSETFLDLPLRLVTLIIFQDKTHCILIIHQIPKEEVCMFCKHDLPVIRRDELHSLSKCIVTEIKLGKKHLFFTCNYRF